MVGYTAWNLLHALHKQQLNDCLRLDVEVVKCGDMIVVKAELNELPLSLQRLKSTREKNNIPHMHVKTNKGGYPEAKGVDLAPKWVPYGEDYTAYVEAQAGQGGLGGAHAATDPIVDESTHPGALRGGGRSWR